MALTELSGTLGEKNAAHLLRRVTFGPTVAQIKAFSALTVTEAMTKIFTDPYPLKDDANYPKPPIDTATGSTWVNPPTIRKAVVDTNSEQDALHEFFKAWHTDVMLHSDDVDTGEPRIKERLTWFLHTHLPARWTRIRSSEAIYYQNNIFRHYSLGNFKELFKKICIDCAMLKYLDGATNKKNSPNENFAREMLELYSIGRGDQIVQAEDSEEPADYTTFTELDVQEATKVLTGWLYDSDFANDDADHDWPTGYLDATGDDTNHHDTTAKTFSARFDSATITGGSTVDGATTELSEMIDMIFAKEATSLAITRKLFRFFVYHFIDDTVESEIIVPLAATMTSSDYDFPTVLKELLSSEFFYDSNNSDTPDDNIGGLIKSPVDLVLGALRFFDAETPDRETDAQTFYDDFSEAILPRFGEQGLYYYEPFEVAGYPPYHQKPGYGRNWIMPSELAYRYQTGERLFKRPGYEGDFTINIDVLTWLEQAETDGHISDAGDASQVVDLLESYFLAVEIDTDRVSYFLDDVFLDSNDLAYWTGYWSSYIGGGSGDDARERLEVLISAFMQSPEYQLH